MDMITLAAARKYVNDTANALGAVKGSPCTIKSITETDEGATVVFSWTGADGVEQTSSTFLPRGPQGLPGEKGEPGAPGKDGSGTVDTVAREQITALTEEIEEINDELFVEEVAIGKNLLNPNTVVPGYLNNGVLTAHADWVTCDYIYVGNLANIVASTDAGIGFSMFFLNKYDKNKKFISANSQNDHKYAVEDGVAYVRFALKTNRDPATVQVESGTVITAFEPYREEVVKKPVVEKLSEDITEVRNAFGYVDGSATMVDMEPTQTHVSYIIKSNFDLLPMETYNETYQVVEYDVSGLSEVYIDAYGSWGAYAYSVFNGDGVNLLHSEQSTSSEKVALTNYKLELPEGATRLLVGTAGENKGAARKYVVTGQVLKTKKWMGKKWVCVGDSLTEVNARASKRYHDYVAESTGIEVVNMGISGSGYMTNNAFHQRIANVPTDADVVTIFGSFNDNGNTLGTATDTGTDTICGCINVTLDNLFAAFPLVKLGIVSPTPWNAKPSSESTQGKYVDALESICMSRGIPFLNLYYCSGLRPWDEAYKAIAYSKDDGNGVHPDENGHALIAPRFKAFLETLIL